MEVDIVQRDLGLALFLCLSVDRLENVDHNTDMEPEDAPIGTFYVTYK